MAEQVRLSVAVLSLAGYTANLTLGSNLRSKLLILLMQSRLNFSLGVESEYLRGWWEKDYAARCAFPAGRAEARCLATLGSNLRSKLLILLVQSRLNLSLGVESEYLRGWWEKDYAARCAFPAGRAEARCLAMLGSNLRSKLLILLVQSRLNFSLGGGIGVSEMVVGEGFEPSKSVTADLQSAPFGRSGIPPWPESLCLKAGRIIPNGQWV